jgi:hypothetical protein
MSRPLVKSCWQRASAAEEADAAAFESDFAPFVALEVDDELPQPTTASAKSAPTQTAESRNRPAEANRGRSE